MRLAIYLGSSKNQLPGRWADIYSFLLTLDSVICILKVNAEQQKIYSVSSPDKVVWLKLDIIYGPWLKKYGILGWTFCSTDGKTSICQIHETI